MIVTSSFDDIYEVNEIDPYIKYGFDTCDLNPNTEETSVFEMHLSSLSENKIYETLLNKNFIRDIASSSI